MRKTILFLLLTLAIPTAMQSQRLAQPLGRGVVAVNRSGSTIRTNVTQAGGQGNLISWRKLAQEPEGTTYNVYRRTSGSGSWTKMNSTPLKKTNYTPSSLTSGYEYAVTAIVNGVEGDKSEPFLYQKRSYPNVWFDFDFDNTVIPRDDYRTKFVWPMDLDGDGEYDAVVCDRLYAGAVNDDAENQSDNTASTTHKIQAYRLTGELLWTVDMGPNVNICGGQNDMVVAYDINCDGRCEVMIKSSDGTRFWDNQSAAWGKYAMGSTVADVDGDGIVDYRTHSVRNCPFYVSVIDGETGAEIACSELKYSEVTDGTDSYSRNNRADYMSYGYAAMEGHFAICYLDGIHPSLVMECLDRETNKTHHNYVFSWDYDWTTGTPSNWHHSATWSRNDKSPWPAEFHQLRVADVDGDGTDEMIQGGYSVNPRTGWFASPGIGHGDRFILSDIDPDRPGLEVYAIQQSDLLGQLIYDARTAERIKEWYLPSIFDVGRGACMDIDASRKGYELYSFTDDYIYDCKGDKTDYTRSGCGINQMFEGFWWNGDLLREELSSPGGSNWGTNLMVTQVLTKSRLIEFSQESSWATHAANGTRPAFMGDIIGDWREEVILAKQTDSSCTGLVGYTTAMPSDYSINCLQQDPHYRGDCTTRGYYQHPNTGYYLGVDMPLPPLPPLLTADLRWNDGANSAMPYRTYDMRQTAAFASGKSIMFDATGNNSQSVTIAAELTPSAVYLMTPRGHDYTLQGEGTFAGDMTMMKSMLGTATFNMNLAFTGPTIISEGTLCINGTVAGPVELRARGTLSGNAVLNGDITFEGALNYEGCRLMPTGADGVITFNNSLTLPGNVYIEVEPGGHLMVNGDLTLSGTNTITVNHSGLEAGSYVIAECTGTLTADVDQLQTRGLEGINYDLMVNDKQLLLIINKVRDPLTGVLWTGAESNVWNYKDNNFAITSDGQSTVATPFVAGDDVVFNAQASNTNITAGEMMVTAGVTFNGGTYTFSGNGGLSGEGGVTVNKGAQVTFDLKNSDYTGATIIDGGTLTVPNLYDGGQKSAIGAADATQGLLQLKNGGQLVLSKDNMGTNRIVTLTDTAAIVVAQANSSLSLKGQVRGSGYLVKDGPGQLNFNYGGTNPFAGLIVRQGIVAQGTWNATFGSSGSPMLLAGGEVHQIDINNTSTVPNLNHAFTIAEGTCNKIIGSSRGQISGSFSGKGDVTIQTRYVRCDIASDFSRFEGTLTAVGAGDNFRLMGSVTDMSKTRLVVGSGTTVSHYKSGSNTAATVTTKIGSLSATATDAVMGGTGSTYQVGYLNEDSQYAGLLTAASIVKVGTATLTLTNTGSTSPITVNGGTLRLTNTTSAKVTTGTITVGSGATLTGNATTGAISLKSGAVLLCELTATGSTYLKAAGNVSHQGDTIVVKVPAGRTLAVGEEMQVISVSGTHSGTFFVTTKSANGVDYIIDSSQLLTTGKLIVTGIKFSVGDVNGDGQVGIADIVAVTNVMAGTASDEAVRQRADVNGDGQVGIADIVAITTIMASGSNSPKTLVKTI